VHAVLNLLSFWTRHNKVTASNQRNSNPRSAEQALGYASDLPRLRTNSVRGAASDCLAASGDPLRLFIESGRSLPVHEASHLNPVHTHTRARTPHARTHACAHTHTPHVFDIHFHIVLAFTDNSLLFFFSSLSICFNLLAYAYFVLSPSHNLRFVCVILRAQYAQCSCSLRSFLQSPVTSSLSTQQAYELPILAQTSLTPRHQQHTQLQPPVWLGCRQKDANFDCQHVQEFFSWQERLGPTQGAQGAVAGHMKLTAHFNLVLRLRMSGAIRPTPLYRTCTGTNVICTLLANRHKDESFWTECWLALQEF